MEVAASREQEVRDCDKRVASLVQGFEILISTFKLKNSFTKKNTFSKNKIIIYNMRIAGSNSRVQKARCCRRTRGGSVNYARTVLLRYNTNNLN